MSLYAKLVEKHPELKPEDFHPATGSILLVDDSDGFGPRIEKWNHPTLAQPSDSELGITRNPATVIIEGEIIETTPMITSDKVIDMTAPMSAPTE
jgi:hypothetical protein